jgi:hypothetical protein
MKTIRHSVFETNSSSCHVVTLLNSYEMEQFNNGELLVEFGRSQGAKIVANFVEKFRFGYDLEHLQFGYDYKEEKPTYYDLPREGLEKLRDALWDLLQAGMKTHIEHFDDKVASIFSDAGVTDELYIERVKGYIEDFAGVSTVNHLMEDMTTYTMPNGEVMHFSCHEFEC